MATTLAQATPLNRELRRCGGMKAFQKSLLIRRLRAKDTALTADAATPTYRPRYRLTN
jgi:hypothetical protein